jgi:hypothetical protein
MKTFLTAAAIVASLGVALPAAAQPWNGGDFRSERSGDFRNDRSVEFHNDRSLELRIDRGVRNGSLTPSEARSLTRQLDDVQRLERQYARNGINGREARELDRRYASLESRLRFETRDSDNRHGRGLGSGYGGGSFGYR